MRLKLVFFCALITTLFPFATFAADEGYFGENPGLDFYSTIDDGAAKMVNGLVQKRLKEYGTFAGFGRTCRTPASWFDSAPMDEQLLQEVSNGIYFRLLKIATAKKITLSSDSLAALVGCLSDAYRDIQTNATNEQGVLGKLGSLGLYTDGDMGNSDYDIVTDIEKINKILFAEEEKYKGTKNTAKSSFADLIAGKPIRSLFGGTDTTEDGEGNGNNGGGTGAGNGTNEGSGKPNPASLGIGSVCRVPGSSGITSVDNLVDDAFLSDLSSTLAGDGGENTNLGANYGNPGDENNTGGLADGTSPDSSSDFFHEIPCDGIFCIKVQMISGNQNLLGGGKNKSIEGIIERHLKIMEPIADSNLASQGMTCNMFELSWSNLKFKNMIPKPLVYISSKPQVTRRDKKDDTPANKDAKLQAAYKCAMYSAGLSNDPNIANSVIGGSYGIRTGTTPTNIENTTLTLGPTDPAISAGASACLDVSLSQGRMAYYNSFSTDLTEIGAFTDAMINEIKGILQSGETIDKLPVQ